MQEINDIWFGDSVELCKRFQPKRMVNCIITDPPFGVDNKSKSATTSAGRANARKIANDQSPEQAIEVFNNVMDSLCPATVDECDMYIFTSYQVLELWLGVARGLSRHGFYQKAMLVWQKYGPGQGDLDYWGMGMEFILYLKKGHRPRSGPRRNAVMYFEQIHSKKLLHPHEKPQELLEALVTFSTDPGDFIVDPFAGSGSLVRCAKMLGRNSIGIEVDETNFHIAHNALHTQSESLI